MMQRLHEIRRIAYGVVASVLTLVALAPSIVGNTALAAQVTTRSMQMSSSAISATNDYLVTFTAPTAVKSLVIDFCGASPIIGAACTGPTGLSVSSATYVAGSGMTGWATGTNSASIFKASSATATTAGATLSFTIHNAVNPSGVGAFYARIYTYVAQVNDYTNATTLGTVADYGGFALSTANTIAISATVMETLLFCVSGSAPGTGCTSTTTPAVVLGHGTPPVIDSTAIDTNTTNTPTYTQLSTNAQSGAIVNMKNSNTSCGGLSSDGGTTCAIPAAGTVPTTISNTAGGFGLLVNAGSGGTGTVSPDANYNGGTGAQYTMDTTGGTGVTSTYGDAIEASTAPCSSVNNQLVFAAIAKATTPAGVYSATMTLIATGKF